MLSYYLDGQPVEGPLNLDGLTLHKARSLTFWGFLYRKLGYVESMSNVAFHEERAVNFLRQVFAKDGVQGETTFSIKQNGQSLYDGYIDYSTYAYDGNAVNVGFRDNRAVVDLENQAATTYGLTPSQTLYLQSRRLGGLAQLVTDLNALTVRVSSANPVPITHTVPLTRKADKDDSVQGTLAPVIHPLVSDPIYHNTTTKEQIINLSGVVSATMSASGSLSATLRAVVFGLESEAVELAILPVTTTPTKRAVIVDCSIRVPVNGSLRLQWTGSIDASSWTFAYNGDTAISLTDENYPDSVAVGQDMHNVFSDLVARSAGSQLTFRSDFLTNNRLFLANGAGLRGINRTLSLAILPVFANLNKLFNLALWVDGSVVRLEEKANAPRRVTTITDLLSFSEGVATDYLYSTVSTGFANWKSDGTLSNDEPNSQRMYSTKLSTLRNGLDLVCEFVGSSALIEQQRRKRYDPKITASTSDNMDDMLFVICSVEGRATDYAAETTENTSFAPNVDQPETLHNTRITPRRILQNWKEWLSASLPATLQSSVGNETMVSTYNGIRLTESEGLANDKSGMPMLVTIETPMTLAEYESLGEVISYPYEGRLREDELLDAVWRKTTNGSQGTLTLLHR